MTDTLARSADELERDIERTRADIDRILTALHDRLSPAAMTDRVLRTARDGGGNFAAEMGRAIRDNPIPSLMVGAGLAWLMIAARSRVGEQGRRVREDPSRPTTLLSETVETTHPTGSANYSGGSSYPLHNPTEAATSAVRTRVRRDTPPTTTADAAAVSAAAKSVDETPSSGTEPAAADGKTSPTSTADAAAVSATSMSGDGTPSSGPPTPAVARTEAGGGTSPGTTADPVAFPASSARAAIPQSSHRETPSSITKQRAASPESRK